MKDIRRRDMTEGQTVPVSLEASGILLWFEGKGLFSGFLHEIDMDDATVIIDRMIVIRNRIGPIDVEIYEPQMARLREMTLEQQTDFFKHVGESRHVGLR